jgi:hypothetical protein
MRHPAFNSAIILVFLFPACAQVPSLAPLAEAGANIAAAGAGLRRAGESAESAAVSLRMGLEGLDPAGIRELLATNAKLRDELESVQRLYLQGMGLGVVDITGREVQVRVTRTLGDLIINAWIDTPTNQFWSGRISNRDVRLPVEIETFLREYPSRRCSNESQSAIAACFGAAQRVAPAAAEVLVQEEFQRYLRTATAVPAPDIPPSIANPRFGGSGEHKLFFEVIPLEADVNGNWAARLEIWLVDPQGNEANVFLYDVDNSRHPRHRMQDPLTIMATLVVRTASPPPDPS